jgi:cell division protein FtsX
MAIVPVMLSVWGVSLVLMLAVSLYAARLGRNEEAQIFLAESSSHVKSEQDEIAARVGKIRPLQRSLIGLASLMTLVVVVYFVINVFRQF